MKEQLQKIQGQVQLYEKYWLQRSIELVKNPERQKHDLSDRENNPLFKGSQLLRKCIDTIRHEREQAAFPFYNWLEEN